MIYDYYLSEIIENNNIKSFDEWNKEKLSKIKEDGKGLFKDFYLQEDDLEALAKNSVLIKISFILKKPYTSKDEGEFRIVKGSFAFSWKDKSKIEKFIRKTYIKDKNNKTDIKVVNPSEDKIEIEVRENTNSNPEHSKQSNEEKSIKKIEIIRKGNMALLKSGSKVDSLFLVEEDGGEVKLYNFKVFENPIVRDKFTGLPIVKPSTWKGHLRFAAEKVELEDKAKKSEIIRRLFGSEPEYGEPLKGRLHFFTTFFEEEAERDVITPLERKTRTPPRGPINLEVMKPGKKGEFYILYFPYPRGKGFKKDQIKEDLIFLAKALKLMFYTYGFSAKKTSGFGVIERQITEGKVWIKLDKGTKGEVFSCLDDDNGTNDGLLQKLTDLLNSN